MTLATLAAVKGKLDIPTGDTSLDTDITACLNAADAFIKGQTGFDETATERTEYLTDVPYDARISTEFRPVDSGVAIVAQARSVGGATWTTLTADLVNALKGLIILVPDSTASWGPLRPKDSVGEHAIVKLAYKTTAFAAATHGYEIPDIIASLAAYWFRESRALAKSIGAGPASESFMNLPLPPHILGPLYNYKRGTAKWA